VFYYMYIHVTWIPLLFSLGDVILFPITRREYMGPINALLGLSLTLLDTRSGRAGLTL
jgi:hypothetical protein